VCRLEESKRLDWIIRSVELFNERADTNVKAKVILVGDGSMRKNLEDRAKLAPYIEVMGGLSMEDLETEFAKAALFAVPALQGYGLPVLEALYRNIPVVVHRDSGVTEALENEKLSMIADGDSEAFAKTVVEALSKVSNNAFPPTPTTRIPTEDGWVEELGQICLWTPSVADRPAS
jgi:glycosyltransferase involved in cell wall biosynthesis